MDRFLLFIDVCSARNLGIRPIPQRILTPEGYVIDEETVSRTDIPGRMGEADDINLDRPSKVGKYTIWERKLLDLTLRNNLINIHSKKGVLQLIGAGTEETLKMLEDGEGFNIFGIPPGWMGACRPNGIFRETSADDPMFSFAYREMKDRRLHSFHDEEATFAHLDLIRKEARHYLEENGANTLYLTIGSLKWIDDDGETPHFAPILLVPVEITKASWSLKWMGEDICANLTLLEKLRQQHGIGIPGLDTLPEKDGCVDVRKVMSTIRRAVMDKRGWDVEELVFLGNFTFNNFIIWNDIHVHREMLSAHPAVSRARCEMQVFSSLQPEQIAENGFVPRGVTDLKAFLKYARDGRKTLQEISSENAVKDLFAEKIAEELRASGKEVHTQIGSSAFRVDVGVVDPDRPGNYLYGILLDGPGYASAESARDREIIRPQVLEGLGWTLDRKWILDRYDD